MPGLRHVALLLRLLLEDRQRLILFGEKHLRHVLDEYTSHYHCERNHQGLGNELIGGELTAVGEITSRERLGGLLRYYHRAA